MKKAILSILSFFIFLNLLSALASAESYKGYTYNSKNRAVPSQIGYLPSENIQKISNVDGTKTLTLKNPTDMFIDGKFIYILDSGNKRVVVTNHSGILQRVIDNFKGNKEKIELIKPTGIFVDSRKNIYIADPESKKVYVFDENGKIMFTLSKPVTNMLSAQLEFKPTKVIVDSTFNVYVIVPGVFQGAVIYDSTGVFKGFFGSNKVEVSFKLINDLFWKKILTRSQVANLSKYVPEEFDNFDIDNENFVYTSTQSAKVWTDRVKKLNPMGVNVLKNTTGFGENEIVYKDGKLFSSTLADINVDSDGLINVIDATYGRIYQYDTYGKLLFIFGGRGDQLGLFSRPVAIDSIGKNVLVLDANKNAITIFKPTPFGDMVHKAQNLYNNGLYTESYELCEEILRQDHNYDFANLSIGKSLLEKGEYRQAAEYFQKSNNREENSEAFKAYRDQLLRKYFLLIVICLLLIFVLFTFINRKIKTTREKAGKFRRKISMIFRSCIHPYSQFEEIKYKNDWSVISGIIIVIVWFITSALEIQLTGFRFNANYGNELNIWLCFLKTIPLLVVWCFANWSVCTLLEGKGRLKEIFIVVSYALIPYVISQYMNMILSHFLVVDEIIFISAITYGGIVWSVIILLAGLSAIHQYDIKKTLLSVLFSVIGMIIMVFLSLLVVNLVWQGAMFVYSLIFELIYRFK